MSMSCRAKPRPPVRLIALCVAAITAVAHADNIDNLIDQLDDSSDRVRTSAVLSLMTQENPRAIDALVRTLKKTSESKNIRGLAATALGRIAALGKPSAAQKKTAIDALNAASSDPEPFVSAKAGAALAQIGPAAGTTPPKNSGPSGGVYVNVGPMSSRTNTADDKKFQKMMVSTASSTLGKVAYGLAYKIIQDAALAEDAVQEAFLQIWRAAGSYRPERAKASTWLLTFVHRRAVDLVRREQTRRTSPVVAEPQGSDPGADEAVVTRSRREIVQDALRRLPAEQREPIELAYYAGLTQSELAERLEQPLGTIKSRMFAGLERLRVLLAEAGYESA